MPRVVYQTITIIYTKSFISIVVKILIKRIIFEKKIQIVDYLN